MGGWYILPIDLKATLIDGSYLRCRLIGNGFQNCWLNVYQGRSDEGSTGTFGPMMKVEVEAQKLPGDVMGDLNFNVWSD